MAVVLELFQTYTHEASSLTGNTIWTSLAQELSVAFQSSLYFNDLGKFITHGSRFNDGLIHHIHGVVVIHRGFDNQLPTFFQGYFCNDRAFAFYCSWRSDRSSNNWRFLDNR
ncbi:hypothetical protein D3C80_1600700 [compost metagenome]